MQVDTVTHHRTRQRQRLAEDGPRPALLNCYEARRIVAVVVQRRRGGVELLHRSLDLEQWRVTVVRQMCHS